MAKMSSTVHGLAWRAPRLHLSAATSNWRCGHCAWAAAVRCGHP